MGKSFLLRFQESQVAPDGTSGVAIAPTGTRIRGEQPDRVAYGSYNTVTDPRRDMEATSGVPSERPDRSAAGEACAAVPGRSATDTLTLTYVADEAPRNDDLRKHSATVLPLAETGTKTAIKGEQPDRGAAKGYGALPEKSVGTIANSTLTYTFVNAEQPRKDERRRAALVLPTCS